MLLAIDTATEWTGIGLWDGAPLAEVTWRSHRRQTAELLPAIDLLFARQQIDWAAIDTIAIVVGPGSFNGIRVGLATATAVSLARNIPVVTVGTLEALAWPFRALGPIAAIIPAGRDYALSLDGGEPYIVEVVSLADACQAAALAVTDGSTLPELGIPTVYNARRRPTAVAAIGAMRTGTVGEPIEPVYLRAPHITAPRRKDPR